MKFFISLVIVIIACSQQVFSSVQANSDSGTTVTLIFNNKVGDEILELGKTYTNPFNESFTVNNFKYYISNISFTNGEGKISNIPESYYLIDEADSTSKSFTINVGERQPNTISFYVGVDSIKNVSGTQTDALDPMNGMFWTWNSGYIMAKLDATSPLSNAPNNTVSYHIGGFRINQNTVRKITLPITMSKLNNSRLEIETDINKWFNGEHKLRISDHQVCMTPGALATQYADNYSRMFSISSSKN